MNKILNQYLALRNDYFLLIVLSILFIGGYIQQEYTLVPQLNTISFINSQTKVEFWQKFKIYRWFLFLLPPLIVLLRVSWVSSCLFVGNIVFDKREKTGYANYFNIALKADIIFLLVSILYSVLLIFTDNETSMDILRQTSLLGLFNITTIDTWLLIPASIVNIFELGYWLFLGSLLSADTHTSYRESMNFVISTYGTGLVLYILFMIFIVLYVSQ